jgi:hypothetical protein
LKNVIIWKLRGNIKTPTLQKSEGFRVKAAGVKL